MRWIILLFVCLYIIYRMQFVNVLSQVDKREYQMATYDNKGDAAELLGRLNRDVIKLLRYMRDKYGVDRNGPAPDQLDRYKIADSMLTRYNPDNMSENDPQLSMDTAYTIGKGRQLLMCLRDRNNPQRLIDYNTLLFVILHEISHIGAYDTFGHGERFWQVFKFVLSEAVSAGVYTPTDYSKRNSDYCGLIITYNPLLDDNLLSA